MLQSYSLFLIRQYSDIKNQKGEHKCHICPIFVFMPLPGIEPHVVVTSGVTMAVKLAFKVRVMTLSHVCLYYLNYLRSQFQFSVRFSRFLLDTDTEIQFLSSESHYSHLPSLRKNCISVSVSKIDFRKQQSAVVKTKTVYCILYTKHVFS